MKTRNLRVTLLLVLIPTASLVASMGAHAYTRPSLDDATVMSMSDARPAAEPRLDPTLNDQLLQALNPPPNSLPAVITDPFVDRVGLTKPGGGLPAARPAVFSSPGPAGPPAAPAGPVDADGRPLKPFADRYRELQRLALQTEEENNRLKREGHEPSRKAPAFTSAYSITEIELYGHAAGGGAWVYSKPEQRAFTIPTNTEFIDGYFVGFDGDEAIFRTKKGRTLRLTIKVENS